MESSHELIEALRSVKAYVRGGLRNAHFETVHELVFAFVTIEDGRTCLLLFSFVISRNKNHLLPVQCQG